MTPLIKASMRLGGGSQPQASSGRSRAPAASAPLGESFAFVEWADEFTLLGLYRRLVIKGDDSAKSLQLIRDGVAAYGYPMVQAAIHAYAAEASGSEPRYRKRPFTFFQPDILSQFIREEKESAGPSQIDQLKASIAAARAAKEEARATSEGQE